MSSTTFTDFLAALDALETCILEALKGGTIQAKAADLWKELDPALKFYQSLTTEQKTVVQAKKYFCWNFAKLYKDTRTADNKFVMKITKLLNRWEATQSQNIAPAAENQSRRPLVAAVTPSRGPTPTITGATPQPAASSPHLNQVVAPPALPQLATPPLVAALAVPLVPPAAISPAPAVPPPPPPTVASPSAEQAALPLELVVPDATVGQSHAPGTPIPSPTRPVVILPPHPPTLSAIERGSDAEVTPIDLRDNMQVDEPAVLSKTEDDAGELPVGSKGKGRVVPTTDEDNTEIPDKKQPKGHKGAASNKLVAPRPKRARKCLAVPTGEFHDTACYRCEQLGIPCEMNETGGACCECRMKKQQCTYSDHTRWKKTRARVPDSTAPLESEDEEQPAVVKPEHTLRQAVAIVADAANTRLATDGNSSPQPVPQRRHIVSVKDPVHEPCGPIHPPHSCPRQAPRSHAAQSLKERIWGLEGRLGPIINAVGQGLAMVQDRMSTASLGILEAHVNQLNENVARLSSVLQSVCDYMGLPETGLLQVHFWHGGLPGRRLTQVSRCNKAYSNTDYEEKIWEEMNAADQCLINTLLERRGQTMEEETAVYHKAERRQQELWDHYEREKNIREGYPGLPAEEDIQSLVQPAAGSSHFPRAYHTPSPVPFQPLWSPLHCMPTPLPEAFPQDKSSMQWSIPAVAEGPAVGPVYTLTGKLLVLTPLLLDSTTELAPQPLPQVVAQEQPPLSVTEDDVIFNGPAATSTTMPASLLADSAEETHEAIAEIKVIPDANSIQAPRTPPLPTVESRGPSDGEPVALDEWDPSTGMVDHPVVSLISTTPQNSQDLLVPHQQVLLAASAAPPTVVPAVGPSSLPAAPTMVPTIEPSSLPAPPTPPQPPVALSALPTLDVPGRQTQSCSNTGSLEVPSNAAGAEPHHSPHLSPLPSPEPGSSQSKRKKAQSENAGGPKKKRR